MLYSHMDEKMAEARIDALIEVTKESRRDKKVSRERTFQLPDLSNLFANWKTGKRTAVTTQA